MSSYILVHRKDVDKRWWNDLFKACAVVGTPLRSTAGLMQLQRLWLLSRMAKRSKPPGLVVL